MPPLVPSLAEINAAVASAAEPDPHSVADAFRSAKAPTGDPRWDLLIEIFQMMLRAGNTAEPLGPICINHQTNKRSMIPDDLIEADIAALRSVYPGAASPAYRARIADVLWLRGRDASVGRDAAEAYRATADLIAASDHHFEAGSHYERALRLAKQIDKRGQQLTDLLDHVRVQVRSMDVEKAGRLPTDLLRLLYEFRHGDVVELGALAMQVADIKRGMGHPAAARTGYDLAAKFWHRGQQAADAERARIAAAETHVEEAGRHVTALGQHGALREAILAYRKIPSCKDRIPALQERLRNAGQATLSSMQTSEFKQDITPLVQHTRAGLTGLSFEDALFRLALINAPIDPDDLRRDVEKQLADSPLQAIFDTTVLDGAGRTTGVVPGLFGASAEDVERGMQHHMHRHAGFERHLTCTACIGPAIGVIADEHDLERIEIERLLSDHPLIEAIFMPYFVRGIEEGLRGDFAVALHLLVPQVERMLRAILYERGVITTSLDKVGVELEWTLGRVLNEVALRDALGPELVFDLKGLLVADPAGSNLRNNMAHGLLPYRASYGVDGVYLWWLLLHLLLCTSPQIEAFKERHRPPHQGA